MSRPVRWSTDALTDFSDQMAYIASENPSAARRVAEALDQTATALGDMPTGRVGRVTGTYEKSVAGLPYIIVYAITQHEGEAIAIVRVIHTSRDWPVNTWPQ